MHSRCICAGTEWNIRKLRFPNFDLGIFNIRGFQYFKNVWIKDSSQIPVKIKRLKSFFLIIFNTNVPPRGVIFNFALLNVIHPISKLKCASLKIVFVVRSRTNMWLCTYFICVEKKSFWEIAEFCSQTSLKHFILFYFILFYFILFYFILSNLILFYLFYHSFHLVFILFIVKLQT